MDSFSFHYVKTPTGEISGASFMQQTEDVINDLGKFATESTQDSTEALRIAKEAMSTADTANANAATALSTANSACLSRLPSPSKSSWTDGSRS